MKKTTMRIECGSLSWKGIARSADEAIKYALERPVKYPGVLLRVHDGLVWRYIEFKAALKMAKR